MQYITKNDLPMIEKNTLKIPLILLDKSYKKISADAKLLFSMIIDEQLFNLIEIEKEFNYSPKCLNKCIKELIKADLIEVKQSTVILNQPWREI